MPSILHVYKDYYPPVIGGVERHISQLAQGTRDDYSIRVLVANTHNRTEIDHIDGIEVVKAASWGRFASAPLCPGFPKLLKKYAADILHFHCPNPTGDLSYLIANPPGKVIVTYHSDVIRQKWAMGVYGYFLRKFLDRARFVLPTSPNYIDSSPFLSRVRARCAVVPLGIETARFRQTPEILERASQFRELAKGLPVILFVGRLRYYKGLVFLIKAMPRVNAHLLIVGEGPEADNIRKTAQLFKVENRVSVLGSLPDADLPACYYAADVFCLPSHLRSEAFGIVQLEAMTCGAPVVSCDIKTGVPFVNRDGETGLVVPPASPSHLAEALNKLLENDALRKRLGENARNRVLAEFDLSVMIDKVKRIYKEILKP
ncbi:glycosyltransferase [Candidatus Sumerlaeota bacterium]|nr:glycosyltransferase [Candidatus Sumerlaeota bacterium]